MRYTLRQLEVFVSVGRYESVSRAAVAVALSQSATSTALGEFERLQVHNTTTIVHQVVHHELDLGLIEGDCHHPDLEVQSWVEDELVVFCAPDYPLARQGSASLEEMMAQPR